jgi:putative membrane protein
MRNILTKEIIKNFVSGFLMGVAEIIPGISGSTIALIFGVYTKFIDLLYFVSEFAKSILQFILRKSDFDNVKKAFFDINYQFAIPLTLGMILAIATMSSVILLVIEYFPQYLYAVLLGLILSVVVVPLKEIKSGGIKEIFVFVITFIILYFLLGIEGVGSIDSNNPNLILLFFGGVIGISAMVLPGISGSFMLLVLGLYYFIIKAIKDIIHLEFTVIQIIALSVFALGMIAGFLTVSQVLKKMLDKYKSILMSFILGLILASARVLWPFVESIKVAEDVEIVSKSIAEFTNIEIALIISIVLGISIVGGYINYKYTHISNK